VQSSILIRGARVHNLKNVSLAIPHNQLTVVTGVSGSGKSSLVFDTIYAEGQRRYVESLSAYARQFLDRMEKPDLDEMEGVSPPIAIRQKNQTRNPRSTVATATELYDFLRLLWARAGRTYCRNCGELVERDTVDPVARKMQAQPEGSRWYALFPIREKQSDTLRDHLFELRKRGFTRLYQNGRTFEFSTPESLLDIDFSQPLFVLVDRLVIQGDLRQRLVDTIEICYRESGEVVFEQAGEPEAQQLRFSEAFSCKRCGIEYLAPEPTLFSFNSPFGACPRCQGFGNTIDYDMDLVVPDRSLSINEGAIDPWNKPSYEHLRDSFLKRAKGKVRFTAPFCDLRPEERNIVFEAVRRSFGLIEQKKYKVHVRVFLSRYRGYTECPDCHGARLRPEALNVRIGERTIAEAVRLNIAEALRFFQTLELSPEEQGIAGKVLVEIIQRLRFLNDVGLEYLTLDRSSGTLSGGEAQRIQLATCLGSRLVGACYVLDEPSIGLHSRDTGRLIRILEELRDLGNTIVVVEHDPDVMRAADHIVDMGPGAGENGGRVVFEGSYGQILSNGNSSLTSRYLRGQMRTSGRAHSTRRPVNRKRILGFTGSTAHNLKNIDVEIPLNMMVVISGVSGSGKSTLVHEVIYNSLAAPPPAGDAGEELFGGARKQTCRKVSGANLIKDAVLVDQSPIGRTPRSNPVTYIKAFDQIREIFASTPESQRRGYTAGHFSFNIPGGRCEVCQGDGTVTVEMQFLADVELVCDECKGTRYKSTILEIRHRSFNIHEVLRLTVSEAIVFFADYSKLANRLKVLAEVGLGYLRLGQSATTLSGGEAQRVKLAAHLAQSSCAGTLYIFDEPTTGLHFDDITKLLDSFEKLIHNGGSILIIEHNMDVIRAADWVIDLGPEGGSGGGRIVVQGTPEQVAACPESHTGRFLKAVL
jgi:excinuclease ABC subunit A